MSKPNEQAFPCAGFSGPAGYGRPNDGMTLRQYAAIKAMQGLLGMEIAQTLCPKQISEDAILLADTLLKLEEETR